MRPTLLPVLALCALVASCAMPRPTQRVLPDPLQYGYVAGSTSATRDLLLNEFIQKNDSIHDWERLVSRQYAKTGASAYDFAQTTANQIKADCPHSSVSIRRISNRATLLEYSHNGCKGWEGHHSVRKFMDGRDGVYMIGFDMKNKDYEPSEFARWRKRITEAHLVD